MKVRNKAGAEFEVLDSVAEGMVRKGQVERVEDKPKPKRKSSKVTDDYNDDEK